MSLFSRLDRVRTGREAKDRDEGGMFGVPDLGTPSGQTPDNSAIPVPPAQASEASEPFKAPTPVSSTPQDETSPIHSSTVTPPAAMGESPTESEESPEADQPSSVFESASPFAVSPFAVNTPVAQSEPEIVEVANSSEETEPQETPLEELSPQETSEQEAQDLARMALGETEVEDPALESPFMSAIMPPLNSSNPNDGLPTPRGPFRRPAMFKGENQSESQPEPKQAMPEEEKDFVSDDTNLNIPAAEVQLPTTQAPLPSAAIPSGFEDLPSSTQAVPAESAPAANSTIEPTTGPSKSPFDRLMAERVSTSTPQPPPAPSANPSSRPSLLDRLNARASNPEATSPPVSPPAAPVAADVPLDRDAEIPAKYMAHVAPASETSPVSASPSAASEISQAAPAELPSTAPQAFVPSNNPFASIPSSKPDTPLEESPVETMAIVEKPAEPRSLSSIVAGTRGFADRLAARESLDRDLNLSVPEASPRPSGAELVRIDEEANLSEKEMKVRVLYRQKHLIFDSVLGSIDPRLMQNPTRETLRSPIERAVDGALREFNLALDSGERVWMIDEFVRETTDVGPLVPLLEDPGISKIIITGANDVSVEKLGRIERVGVSFRDDDHLLGLVRRIAEMTGGRIDAKVPLLDRPLPDGSRIRAKVPPIAPQPSLTIEKSTGNPFVALKRMMNEKTRGEALPYNQLRERIQLRLLREFEGNTAATANQEKLRVQVEEMIGQVIIEEKVAVTRAEKAALVMDLLNEIVGLGPLEPLLNDPDVDEVMVNGPYQIYVERKGKLELSNQRFRDNAHAMQVIERIIAPLGRRIDEKSPMVDGRLRDGSRFNAIIPPLALGGPTMTIRKFARDPFTMTDLINFGSLTREAAQFLHAAVEGRLNVIVSGGTGSGKTTTLNVLSSFIPSTDRIVTIEDAAELQLRQEHTIRLETRPANIEGVGEITIRDLVRNALRMRPDRIVVGECRGGEALDMLQAMNTGHDGSLTTAHSNGPRDTLKRLETMVMMAGFDLPIKAIREQVAMAVQLIVHQERMRDGKRRITAITEIVGMEGEVITLQDLYRFEQDRIDDEGRIHGVLAPTGLRPKNWDTIVDNGVELSMDLFQRPQQDSGVRSRLSDHRVGAR